MKDQTVIVGFGVKGQAALRSLIAHGLDPRTVVVIASDRYAVAEATRQVSPASSATPVAQQVLRERRHPRGQPGDRGRRPGRTAIMVTCACATARTATIAAAAREASAGDLLRQSGADRVITHAESAGNLMGLSLLGQCRGDARGPRWSNRCGLEVVERPISRAELG